MKSHMYPLNRSLLLLFLLFPAYAVEEDEKGLILHTKDPVEDAYHASTFLILSSSLASVLVERANAESADMEIVGPTYVSGFYSELAQILLGNRVHDASVVREKWYRTGASDAKSFIDEQSKKGKSKGNMLTSLGFVKVTISGSFVSDDSFVDARQKIKAFVFQSDNNEDNFTIDREKGLKNKREITGWLSPAGHYVPGGQGNTFSRIFIIE